LNGRSPSNFLPAEKEGCWKQLFFQSASCVERLQG